jgi:hypothetical protein
MTALEIRDIFKGFETVDLYYIKNDNDGHEVIWRKSTMIKDGQEKVMCDGFFHNADYRPEGVDEHTYLVNFLHKLEERRKQDVDEDDNTVFTFHDDSEDNIFSIYEGFVPALEKKIKTIQNKCKKYGCSFIYEKIGEEFKEVPTGEVDPYTGKPVKVSCRFIKIHVEGTAIINDWEFVASVEHTEAGNIYSKAMNDLEIPVRYRNAPCTCEHCNTKRIRKNSFIIHNTRTGEFKQVGNTCLKDFTHGMSASGMAWFASLKQIFETEEDRIPEWSGMAWYQKFYSVQEVLQYTAETIRKFGYSKQETKVQMQNFFDVLHGDTRYWKPEDIREVMDKINSVGFNADSPEAVQKATDALEWIKVQDSTTDYMHNLKTVCALSMVNSSKFGLLVSVFPAMDRDLEKQEQLKQDRISNHVGNIGDRITVDVESIKCLTSWESNFGYYPTITYLYKITGTDGNVYTWKTQKGMDEDHPPKTIKGTIKDHTEFREVKQTVLTRCKIA